VVLQRCVWGGWGMPSSRVPIFLLLSTVNFNCASSVPIHCKARWALSPAHSTHNCQNTSQARGKCSWDSIHLGLAGGMEGGNLLREIVRRPVGVSH